MSATPAKVKKAAKPKKPSTHPKYSEMIVKAVTALKERGGSSRQAILKHILANFNVGKDAAAVNSRLKVSLKKCVAKGVLKQSKGKGASGSFRVGEKKAEKKAKAPKKKGDKAKKAKKPRAKKAAVAAAPEGGEGAAPAKPKKAKSPKKAKAAKPKKAKSPKKAKAAKPKKAKTPKKAKSPKKAKKSPKKAKAAKK